MAGTSGETTAGLQCDARPAAPLDAESVEVLALLADGHTISGVARRLEVSERTVRRRLRTAADLMGAGSTIETVVRAVRRGVI
jgi:DNA-binding NarL/FixJ family response regulator